MGRIMLLMVGVTIVALAGEVSAETFLLKSGARIYGVLEKQPEGEQGAKWMTVRTAYGRVRFKKADLKRTLTKGEDRTTLYIDEARIMSVWGAVFKSDDAGKSWARIPWNLGKGDTTTHREFPPLIRAGESVKTGMYSAVEIDVGWGVVRLASESVLTFQMSKGATLRLTKGKLGARLEDLPKGKRFRVETPEASMGVEGTVFIIEKDVNTRLAVLYGAVKIRAKVLRSRQVLSISSDGVTTPGALTQEDWIFGGRLARAVARPRIDWVLIPSGSFKMGNRSPPSADSKNSEPVHDVRVSEFLLGRYEVTEGQYRQFMFWLSIHGDTDLWPDGRPGSDEPDYRCNADLGLVHNLRWLTVSEQQSWSQSDLCVYRVDWRGANAFSRWVGGRLPSEAEWEYAALAEVEGGPRWPHNLQGTRHDHAWSIANSGRRVYRGPRVAYETVGWEDVAQAFGIRPRRVGLKLPNPLGVHDMYGNAREWVEDTNSDSYEGAPSDGSAWIVPGEGARIVRGSDWLSYPDDVQGTPWSRMGWLVFRAGANLAGFRVARDLPR